MNELKRQESNAVKTIASQYVDSCQRQIGFVKVALHRAVLYPKSRLVYVISGFLLK